MKTLSAILVSLALVGSAVAAPAGWSRPGGYFDQAQAGSIAKQSSNNGQHLCDLKEHQLNDALRAAKSGVC